MDDHDTAPRETAAASEPGDRRLTPLLTWDIDIPLLNNRFIVWDFLKVTSIAAVLMLLLIAAMGWVVDGEPLLMPPWFTLLILGIMWVLFPISCLVLLNRWGFRNTIYEEGVGYASGQREKKVNRWLTLFGVVALLSGSATGLGTALLARSREDDFYPWSDLYTINAHPGPRVISLRNSWRVVYRLFCTPETYPQALALCERKVAEATTYRAAHPVERVRRPWGRWALWSLACGGAFALALAWDRASAEEVGLPIMWAAVAAWLAGILEGPLRRVAGAVALAVAVWFVYQVAVAGFAAAVPDFVAAGLYSPPAYVDEEIPFALSIVGGAAVAALGGWRAFAPARKV